MMSAQTAQPAFDLAGWSQHHLDRVEQALGHWVGKDAPARLGEAMRYAVLDGGKRLRPLLVLAAFEAVHNGAGDAGEAALRAACAVELIHAYSLVHDDMPCMDNDVLRRGKPTVHVQFGEAQACWQATLCRRLRSSCSHRRMSAFSRPCRPRCAASWRAPPDLQAWRADRRLTWPAWGWR